MGKNKSKKFKSSEHSDASAKSNNRRSNFPKRWLNHSKINSYMTNTRFIAFKTPLAGHFFAGKPKDDVFHVDDVVQQVQSLNKTLGLVIDLTDTDRYYDSAEWAEHRIDYVKLPYSGHAIHMHQRLIQRFKNIVNEFLDQNSNPDILIGVHCTHGVNRTGYLICRYLIDCKKWTPEDALSGFESSRSEPVIREAYIEHLKTLGLSDRSQAVAVSTHQTGSNRRQHNPKKRNRRNRNATDSDNWRIRDATGSGRSRIRIDR